MQRLLARVEDLSRNNQEMVSSKVHDQLLRLADERADRAERKLKESETEVSVKTLCNNYLDKTRLRLCIIK